MTLLKDLSYYQTGGSAAHVFLPKSLEETKDALAFAKKNQLPIMYLGAGTNSLVMDTYWDGCVICMKDFNQLHFDPSSATLSAEAGAINSDIANFAMKHQLLGSGWMNGLPGQIGATARMNARCYGGEISQIACCVETITADGEHKIYDTSISETKKQVFVGYKDTIFMRNQELIVKVHLKLTLSQDPKALEAEQEKMNSCLSDRQNKGQFDHPSCGCVFKNNYTVGVPSGKLLEKCGAKDMEHMGAKVSPHHANFVFNHSADSRGILELTLMMRQRVYDQLGIWLEYEMEILGHIPEDLKERLQDKP